jgi:hypothetical protein
MTTKQNRESEIHVLTVAEIDRQVRLHSERRRQIVNERAGLYAHALKNNGSGAEAPIDADEYAAREIAKSLLNGSAPPSLLLPPEITRDKLLYREERAIDIILKIFGDKALVARAVEAVEWAEAHRDEWRHLAREITLNAVRLDALECRAKQLLEGCSDPSAVRLPMILIVNSRAISEIPLNDLKAAALAEGIVTAAEIRKFENVE